MRYIDADKIISEIQRLHDVHSGKHGCDEVGLNLEYLGDFITTLLSKQEQPEDEIKREWYNKGYLKGRQEAHIPARELGLPKAFDFKPLDEDFERDAVSFCFDNGLNTTPFIAKTIARHFYELGLNARKEEFVGVAESPSKTFPRVNEFDCGG